MSSINSSFIRNPQSSANKEKVQQIKSPSELRILDYRNAKYQGVVNPENRKKQDIGILIDDKLTFILANWKNNIIDGPFFIAYPDQQILFGEIKNKQISSFACCELPAQYTMYIDKKNKIVVVDLHASKNILTVKADIKNFTDSKFLNRELIKNKQFIRNKYPQEQYERERFFMEIIKQQKYDNVADKFRIIQKNLSIKQIPDYYKNYKLFIDQFFLKNKNLSSIEVVQTKQDFSINFKKCNVTLMLKILQKNNLVKIVGCSNKLGDNYQFYKKYNHSSNVIEEGILKKTPVVIQYNLLPCNRPKICQINLKNYHKQAITFINQFCDLDYIYHIRTICSNLQEEIKTVAMNKYAQILLEDVDKKAPRFQINNQKNRKLSNKDALPDTFTLSQVRDDILKAVSRKKQKNFTNNNSMYQSPTKMIQPRQVFAASSNSKQKDLNRTFFVDKTRYDRVLQQSRRSLSSKRDSPIKKMDNSFYKNTDGNNTLRKFQYLQEEQRQKRYSNQRYLYDDNLKRMTQDLQRIKTQIKLSTPKSKKRTPYKATNLSNKIYTQKKQDSFNTPVRDSSKKRNLSPLGSKKIFKYLPN